MRPMPRSGITIARWARWSRRYAAFGGFCLRPGASLCFAPGYSLDAAPRRFIERLAPARSLMRRNGNAPGLISHQDGTPENPEKSGTSQESAAQGAALLANTLSADPQLASVIDAWPTLPSAIRGSIVAIIQATGGHHA